MYIIVSFLTLGGSASAMAESLSADDNTSVGLCIMIWVSDLGC